MRTFTLSDLSRRPAEITHAAARAPVTITQRDKPRFVVLAIEDYENLRRGSEETRRVYTPATMPPEVAEPFLASLGRDIDDAYGE